MVIKSLLLILFCFLPIFVCSETILDKMKQLNVNKDYQAAILSGETYLKENPKDGDVRFYLAKAYLGAGQEEQAFKELASILKEYPQYDEAALMLADLKIKKQAYDEALEVLKTSLLVSPDNTLLKEKVIQIKKIQAESLINEKITSKKEVHPPNFKAMYDQGKGKLAIDKAQKYLKEHPQDVDVSLMLATIYMREQKFKQAQALVAPFIQEYPDYIDLRLVSIQANIKLKNYATAKKLVIQGLKRNAKNKELIKKKADIDYLMKPKKIQPKLARKETHSPEMPNPPQFKNEIGVLQQNYYITDVHQVWDYTSIFYGRQTRLGKLFGRVNYANRLHRDAPQFEIEFFPKLNKYIYLDLAGAVANQPMLFPHYNYLGEVFFVLPKLFNVSGGGQFNRIDSIHHYARFTTSIAKDWKEHTLMFRPYFYNPGKGPRSILYTLNYRYMFLEPYGHWGLILGTGSTPDLADLQTVNFLKLQNKIISPYLNFAMLNDQLNINISLLYQHQIFPSQRIRDWWGGTLGLAWRY